MASPLPPLSDWLRRSFGRAARRCLPMAALGLAGALITAVVLALILGTAVAVLSAMHGEEAMGRLKDPHLLRMFLEDPGSRLLFRAIEVLAAFVGLRVLAWFQLGVIHLAADPSLGLWAAMRLAKARAFGFLLVLLGQQVLVQLGLLALVLPGLYLTVRLALAPVAHGRGRDTPLQSLQDSWRLSRGRGWALFGRLLALGLCCAAVALVPVAGWVFAPALGTCGWVLLYQDAGGEDWVRVR